VLEGFLDALQGVQEADIERVGILTGAKVAGMMAA
jgi:hypothetical protein